MNKFKRDQRVKIVKDTIEPLYIGHYGTVVNPSFMNSSYLVVRVNVSKDKTVSKIYHSEELLPWS